MAFLFLNMEALKINKIHYFVVISVIFHVILFLAWAVIAYQKKHDNYIEVFMMQDVTPLRDTSTALRKEKTQVLQKNYIKEKTKEVKIKNPEQTESISSNSISIENETATVTPVEGIRAEKITSTSGFHNVRGESENIIETSFGTVHGPRFIHRENPVYPQLARRLGKEGKVLLKLTISEKGELINIDVIESDFPPFTEAALEALKKSKFAPAVKDGKPIASRAILPVRFVLKN